MELSNETRSILQDVGRLSSDFATCRLLVNGALLETKQVKVLQNSMYSSTETALGEVHRLTTQIDSVRSKNFLQVSHTLG